MAAIRATMATTTIISMSVTPETWGQTRRLPGFLGKNLVNVGSVPGFLLVFPADDVGIQSFAAGLAISAVADDVGFVAVLAREFVDVVVTPRVFRDVLRHV